MLGVMGVYIDCTKQEENNATVMCMNEWNCIQTSTNDIIAATMIGGGGLAPQWRAPHIISPPLIENTEHH